ncbi:hypothetical protein ACRAWF_11110 [Streptomyces sp. L7]
MELQPRLQQDAGRGHQRNWGLGWFNNPANPIYPPVPCRLHEHRSSIRWPPRTPRSRRDGRYEEKVLGWASWSHGQWATPTPLPAARTGRANPDFSSAGFCPATWNGTDRTVIDPSTARSTTGRTPTPPLDAFCNTKNNCDTANPPDCPTAGCYTQYWWHESNATWKSDCAATCGIERHQVRDPDQ